MTGPVSAMLGFGLLGVFCLAFAEKILPVPPSHAVLLFLGMTSISDGQTFAALLSTTTLGSSAGCLVWYAVGRRLGSQRADALVERFGRYVFLQSETYRKFGRTYRRNHVQASLLAQFVPTVRNYLPIAAGALRLAFMPFAAATMAGAMMWNAGFLFAGYLMRGSGQDVVALGFRIIVVVLALEGTFLLGLRLGLFRR